MSDAIVNRLDRMIELMSPQPLATLLSSEMMSNEDLDGNDLVFGIDFLISIPLESYPELLRHRVEEIVPINGKPTFISVEEYVKGINPVEKERALKIINNWTKNETKTSI